MWRKSTTDSAAPKPINPLTDKDDPMHAMSKRDNVEPKRTMLLIDTDAPRCRKSTTDKDDPNRANPLRATELPTAKLSISKRKKLGRLVLKTSGKKTTCDTLLKGNDVPKLSKKISAKENPVCENDLEVGEVFKLMQYDIGERTLKHVASDTVNSNTTCAEICGKIDMPKLDTSSDTREAPVREILCDNGETPSFKPFRMGSNESTRHLSIKLNEAARRA